MATVTGLTAARMLAIEAASIVSGAVVGGNLILTKHDGTTVNAGSVAGATGATGPAGPVGATGNTILSGTGSPVNSNGTNGDFYLDRNTMTLYGPKSGGSWPSSGTSLIGPQGPTSVLETAFPVYIGVALSKEDTAVTPSGSVAANKIRAPYGFTLTEVRVTESVAGASVVTTVDVKNGAGSSIFSTLPTINAGSKTTVGATTPAVISTSSISNDEELSFFITAAGSDVRGIKAWLIGTRSVAVAPSVPSAPGTPSATYGATQVTLSWTVPASNGGASITGYRVRYSSNGGSTWTTFGTDFVGASGTVTGLTNETAYVFQVAAINSVVTAGGSPVWSGSSASTTPHAIPGVPTSLTPTAGTGQVTLAWTAPTSSFVEDYTVQYSVDGLSWTTFSDPITSSTGATVTGLTNGTPYVFRVRAINNSGLGNYTAASSSVTPTGASVPGAPTAVSGGSPTATTVTLTWTAPASNGGASISGYSVRYSSNGGASWTEFGGSLGTDFSASPGTVTGLAAATSYIFQVAAVNSTGQGAWSTSSASVTTSSAGGAQSLAPAKFKYLQSNASNTGEFGYADALNGTADSLSVLPTAGNGFIVGQSPIFFVTEGLLEFNTAVGGSSVTSESFAVTIVNSANIVQGFTLELYGYDFGSTIEAADWRTPTQIGAMTLLASAALTSSSSGTITLTPNGTNLRSYIQSNLAGTSRFLLVSSRTRTSTAPISSEYVQLNGGTATLSFTAA